MENYELYIPPSTINPVNGRFRKKHEPFNKGLPMKGWMDGRKIKKVMKCLLFGRIKGNVKLSGWNARPIIGIKDGILSIYPSAAKAARILKSRGIKVSERNIISVCKHKPVVNGKYSYIRMKAGGYKWFYESEYYLK